MKKAWNDLKSFITVSVMLLFAFCVVFNREIPEELKIITTTVVSFFLGTKTTENGNKESEKK